MHPHGTFFATPASSSVLSACRGAPSRTAHIVKRCPLDLMRSHTVLQAKKKQYPHCYLGLHTDKCCHNIEKTLQVSHPKGTNEFGQRALPPLTLLGLFQTPTDTTSLKYFMLRNISCCAPHPHGKESSRTPKLGPKASDHPSCMLEKALTQLLHALWGSNAQKKHSSLSTVPWGTIQTFVSALKYELQRHNIFSIMFLALL